MWLTRDTLMNGAVSGHYFENYVVMELVKHYASAPSKANLERGAGGIVCMCENVIPIDEKNCFIPVI